MYVLNPRWSILLGLAASTLLVSGCEKGADVAPEKVVESAEPAEAAEAAATGAEGAKPAAGDKTLTFVVEGMVCGGCEQAISDKVSSLAGVKSCTADHKAGQAVVVLDGDKVKPEKIAAMITELGYKTSVPK